MSTLLRLWDRFWFPPVDARALAMMRIGLGLIMLIGHLALWPLAELLLGPMGPVPLETALLNPSPWRFSVYDLATTVPRLHLIHGLGALCMLSLTLGFRTRISAIACLVVLISLANRDRWMMDGGDRLLRVMALYLAVAPTGLAWSVDAWWARRRGALTPALAPGLLIRLVQLQLMWMYFDAGQDKLRGEEWRQGTALYYTLSDTGLHGIPFLFEPILTTSWGQALCTVGTYGSMSWELGFFLMVLWRPTRLAALAIGVVFHLIIALVMGIDTFSYTSMWGYLAFLSPAWLGSLPGVVVARLRGRMGGGG